MMKRKNLQLLLIGLLIAFGFTACLDDDTDSVEDYDTVLVEYDRDFNFDSKQYYLLPDTVTMITDVENYEKSAEELALDDAILAEIETQMEQAGYTKLTPADTADSDRMDQAVIVTTSRATVTYVDYYTDYYNYGRSYWGWYYGFNHYFPGYYWDYYYPWGYPVNYAYTYSVGTVVIEMVDPADPYRLDDDNGEVVYPVRWLAVLNGLAEMSYENTEERITDGIEEAFTLSPFLTTD